MKKILLVFILALFAVGMQAKTYTVNTSGMTFSPSTLSIKAGDTVKWVCSLSDGIAHTTTSGSSCKADGHWNSGNMAAGASYTHVFDTAGTFNYFCIYHCSMGMTGSITVASSTGIADANLLKLQYSVYPNPVAGYLHLQVNMPQAISEPTDLSLSLYTINGRPLFLHTNRAIPGNNMFTVDMQNYPAGEYIIRLYGSEIVPENLIIINK